MIKDAEVRKAFGGPRQHAILAAFLTWFKIFDGELMKGSDRHFKEINFTVDFVRRGSAESLHFNVDLRVFS